MLAALGGLLGADPAPGGAYGGAKWLCGVCRRRTATKRINSQAVKLGIERPKLRNGASIANHNTLTYVLINMHALQRVRQRLGKATQAETAEEGA